MDNLTHENYHSPEMNKIYMGSTQYKGFCGSMGLLACEAKELAKLNGEWIEEASAAMLQSSYVDAHFAGTMALFKAKNSSVFKKNGELMATYVHMNKVIARIERDPFFMKYMNGETQKIFTAEMFGSKWKVAIDVYHKGVCLVDLKVMKSISELKYVHDVGKVTFIEYYGYFLQAAIYQKIVELATGDKLPFFIAAASKEKPEPDIAVIQIKQSLIDEALIEIETNMPRILRLKAGEAEPDRCDICDYCKSTKVLDRVIDYEELKKKI